MTAVGLDVLPGHVGQRVVVRRGFTETHFHYGEDGRLLAESDGRSVLQGAARRPDGSVVVTGDFVGDVNFGGGALRSSLP